MTPFTQISHVSSSSVRRRGLMITWFWINQLLSIHIDSCMYSCRVSLLCPTLWINSNMLMICLMFMYFLPTQGLSSQSTFCEFVSLTFCLLHLRNTAVFVDLHCPYGLDVVLLYCLAPFIVFVLWLVCSCYVNNLQVCLQFCCADMYVILSLH